MPYYIVCVRQGEASQPISTFLWPATTADEAIRTLAEETRSDGEYAAFEAPNLLRKTVTYSESPVISDPPA